VAREPRRLGDVGGSDDEQADHQLPRLGERSVDHQAVGALADPSAVVSHQALRGDEALLGCDALAPARQIPEQALLSVSAAELELAMAQEQQVVLHRRVQSIGSVGLARKGYPMRHWAWRQTGENLGCGGAPSRRGGVGELAIMA